MTSSTNEMPLLKADRDPRERRWFVYLAFIFPACAGFLFGFDIGAASGCVNSLKTFLTIDDLLSSTITSASLIGATIGSLLVFFVGEPLGRRREIMIGAGLYLTGSLLCVLTPRSAALGLVIVGRIIYGLGIAFSMHAAPVYISEMAPADIRGLLVSLKEGFIVGGIMMGFAMAYIAESVASCPGGDCADAADAPGFNEGDVFRLVWGLPLVISPIVLLGMMAMPPSPRWLVLRAQRTRPTLEPLGSSQPLRVAALESLRRFRRGLPEESLEAELAEIEATLEVESAEASGSFAELLSSRRALVAGLGLICLQQLTGQPSVLYYQETIFKDAGFGSSASSVSVIVGGAKLLATLCTVSIVDRFGRRPLLFVGISMMLLALLLLTVGFQLATPDSGSGGSDVLLAAGWPPVIVFSLVLYVCGYQVGFGPIAWLIISEVFPIRTRTRALSLAVIVNFGFNLGATFALKPLQTGMDSLSPGKGSSYLFMVYAVFCVVSLLFVHRCVPETKGKSLEEIEQMLKR